MILKWWWSAWWERTQVWSVDSRYLWSRANKDLLIVWKISANPAVWAPERVLWWQCSSQVSSFLKFWFILVCSWCQVPCPLTAGLASRENNPNSALNHFGKHPSWEVLRNAKNGTNPCQCYSRAGGNFHTLRTRAGVTNDVNNDPGPKPWSSSDESPGFVPQPANDGRRIILVNLDISSVLSAAG